MDTNEIDLPVTVDQAVFRDVVGHFTSGVTVITTSVDGVYYGTTASAVTSLSMEPPMMLMCLNQTSQTHDAVKRAGRFVINILAADQGGIAYAFAKKGTDKFENIETQEIDGLPAIQGTLARLVCHTVEETRGGTHTVFLARVVDAQSYKAEPLTYYRGKFGRFNPDSETAAYQEVREWVLRHRNLKNQAVTLSWFAEQLGRDREQISRALAMLATDRLVTFGADESVNILPITNELMAGALDARAAIQCGVLVNYLDSLTDERLARMKQTFNAMKAIKESSSGDLRDFLQLNATFQDEIVGLANSADLIQAFKRMGIGAVWYESLSEDSWANVLDDTHQLSLLNALEVRDVEKACRAVQAHGRLVKNITQRVIESRGGQI